MGKPAAETPLDNLSALLIDEVRVEFEAAAIVLAGDSPRDKGSPTWWLLVTDPSVALPREEMAIAAVTRAGAIYVGRGMWKSQQASSSGTFQTHLIEGVHEVRVGDISQLSGPVDA